MGFLRWVSWGSSGERLGFSQVGELGFLRWVRVGAAQVGEGWGCTGG